MILRILFSLYLKVRRIYWRVFNVKRRGARAMIIRGDQVLLVLHKWGNDLHMPGGGIKKNETFAEGVFREIEEELQAELPAGLELLGEYTSRAEGKQDTSRIFISQVPEDWEPGGYQAIEIEAWDWYNLEHLPENVSPGTMRRIREYVSGQKNVQGIW